MKAAAKRIHKTVRLNEKEIRLLKPPEKGNRIKYDDTVPGFGVRITTAGSRAFVLTYWFEGRQRRMTIGGWPEWTATAAREHAKKLRKQIDKGDDPLEQKQERREADTFAAIADKYLERHAFKKKSGDVDRARLKRDVLPKWRNRKARDIGRADVIRLVEKKAEAAPIAANRLLALVRKVFNWAIEKDLLKTPNPCAHVKAPAKENVRDRVLTDAEIRTFWRALESGTFTNSAGKPQTLAMSAGVRSILQLVLVTAQRPGECAGMEWSEIDAEPGWWTISAAKTKANRAHRVPLSKLAREIINAQPREGRFVFPSPRGDKGIEVNALTHALRNNDHLGLKHFGAHDLRRTATSYMPADRFIKGRILNHGEKDVTGIHYDRYDYADEKKRALDAWGRKLTAIVSGKGAKVVSIS